MTFILDSRLANDGILLSDTSRYILNLVNDNRYVWLVLIPKIANVKELHDLPETMQTEVALKSNQLAACLKTQFMAEKINTAAIGNIVSQLHIHIVARHTRDAAWPSPVWGYGTAVPYSPREREKLFDELRPLLAQLGW